MYNIGIGTGNSHVETGTVRIVNTYEAVKQLAQDVWKFNLNGGVPVNIYAPVIVTPFQSNEIRMPVELWSHQGHETLHQSYQEAWRNLGEQILGALEIVGEDSPSRRFVGNVLKNAAATQEHA